MATRSSPILVLATCQCCPVCIGRLYQILTPFSANGPNRLNRPKLPYSRGRFFQQIPLDCYMPYAYIYVYRNGFRGRQRTTENHRKVIRLGAQRVEPGGHATNANMHRIAKGNGPRHRIKDRKSRLVREAERTPIKRTD